jgi:hypothetical protein
MGSNMARPQLARAAESRISTAEHIYLLADVCTEIFHEHLQIHL